MKVNLLLNGKSDIRSGYLNIDPGTPDGCADGRVKADLVTFGGLVEDGEATEIVAFEILDAFAADHVDEVLDSWLKKLAHGGTIAITVIDLKDVARSVIGGVVGLEEANVLLHGSAYRRQCSLTVSQLAAVLEGKGLKVIIKRVQNFRATVVAERP